MRAGLLNRVPSMQLSSATVRGLKSDLTSVRCKNQAHGGEWNLGCVYMLKRDVICAPKRGMAVQLWKVDEMCIIRVAVHQNDAAAIYVSYQ
jgi:hypothetical protein